jgi:hypothetical protein
VYRRCACGNLKGPKVADGREEREHRCGVVADVVVDAEDVEIEDDLDNT